MNHIYMKSVRLFLLLLKLLSLVWPWVYLLQIEEEQIKVLLLHENQRKIYS